VVGDRAELTGATDAAGSSTATVERAADVGGRWRSSLVTRAERERGRGGLAEGANERGEVGEQGARLKRGARARTWSENTQSWARPRRGIVGGRLGMTDKSSEREGVSAQAGADSGPRLSGTEGTRAGLGWLGLNGPKWLFLFPGNF
jgi:hypothetical protein